MGTYAIAIEAVGGHGCQRHLKDGEVVPEQILCQCPDCSVKRFVNGLKAQGSSIVSATLTHWPGQPGTVVDDLVTGIRKGSF